MLRHRLPLLLLLATPALAAGSDLIFYADFDHGPVSVCGSGWAVDMPTETASFVAGRFGQAYRMERRRTNLLSANQADVESNSPPRQVLPTSVRSRCARLLPSRDSSGSCRLCP